MTKKQTHYVIHIGIAHERPPTHNCDDNCLTKANLPPESLDYPKLTAPPEPENANSEDVFSAGEEETPEE